MLERVLWGRLSEYLLLNREVLLPNYFSLSGELVRYPVVLKKTS